MKVNKIYYSVLPLGTCFVLAMLDYCHIFDNFLWAILTLPSIFASSGLFVYFESKEIKI